MTLNESGAPSQSRRGLLLGALWGSMLLGATTGCDGAHGETPPADPGRTALEVRVVRPIRQDLIRKVVLPGSVRADLEVTLYSKVTGFLKDITKDRGDKVKAGELIAKLEIPEMISEIEHARASAALDESTFKRLEAIRKVEKTAVTDQDLDMARAKRDMSQATLQKLETLQAYTEIRAPFSGSITERFVDPGAFIQQGKVVSMVDISKVRVLVDIPESEVRAAQAGTPAEVQFDALPGKTFPAAVSRSAGSLDTTMRTMRVEIDVQNPAFLIYPGMFARVTLDVDPHPMALVLPSEAVTLQQDRAFVFVEAEGKAKKIPVRVGMEDGRRWEILKGLTGAESVLIPEGKPLVEGVAVKIVEGPKSATPTKVAERGDQ
ncbi:MAG TPA: efflux RND transporter periplasmic adaptor subunit [Planctomycetota bacterium]|nr:efflux RND transporter periplasmic adaptor subunit [Planctomycetota bacterium]